MTVRQVNFSTTTYDILALGTVQNTISDISATFRENHEQQNPTKDNYLQLRFIISRQFWAYKNTNPKGMVQACVGHFVTPLKRRWDASGWEVMSQKPHKKNKSLNKHHHHGSGAACPPAQRRGFDEPTSPKGRVALHMLVPMPPSKRFNRFNKLK